MAEIVSGDLVVLVLSPAEALALRSVLARSRELPASSEDIAALADVLDALSA